MTDWTPICPLDALVPDRGSAALVHDSEVALFRLSGTEEVYAVGHHDPFTGAPVVARGLVGSRGDIPTVASPLHKQVFDLRTGSALDHPGIGLERWEATVNDRIVYVRRAQQSHTAGHRRTGHPRAARSMESL